MTYTGKYNKNRIDGDIFADTSDGPPWATVGALVAKSAGWTAMKVLKVDKGYSRNPILTICYGPDDEKHGVTEERACNTLRPFDDQLIIGLNNARCFWPEAIKCPLTRQWWAAPEYLDAHTQHETEMEIDDMAQKAKRNDLFQWMQSGKKAFGIFLTEDADGQWVMQIVDGDKSVVVVDPDTCEKVMPYTIEVKNFEGGSSHWKARKGQVKVGDIVITEGGSMVRVINLDTKHESASFKLDGRVVQTKPLGKGVEDDAPVIE